jgi:hypothetical protein
MLPTDPIEETIKETIAQIASTDHLLHRVTIIHDMRIGTPRYMSAKGLARLGISLSELREMGG